MLNVSIITPSYNQGNFLAETIPSVIGQHYPNLEYIIIDGGSTDNSVSVIKKYEKEIAYWVSEPDKGQSHAVNKGLQKATGDIIGWLNSDDRYYEGAIQKAIHVFSEHPEVDIVFGNVDFIDEQGTVLHRTNELAVDFHTYLFTNRCYHANAAGFFRKRCFDLYGMLREDLKYTMDYELYLRFAYNRYKFYQMKDVLGSYRLHAQSKTLMHTKNMALECKISSDAYKRILGIHPIFYGLLKYYYTYLRVMKKMFALAYSPRNIIRGVQFRWKYSA
jgi:glycosyltransferase involved in cell wall biosynthesis